jgi:hypothetical protein
MEIPSEMIRIQCHEHDWRLQASVVVSSFSTSWYYNLSMDWDFHQKLQGHTYVSDSVEYYLCVQYYSRSTGPAEGLDYLTIKGALAPEIICIHISIASFIEIGCSKNIIFAYVFS